MCYSFVWNNKPDRISRKTVVKSVRDGGLGFPDIKKFISSLKLTWIRKFKKTQHKWKNILTDDFVYMERIELYGPEVIKFYTAGNLFWKEVFQVYKEFFYKLEVKALGYILAEPVCFNEKIMVGHKVIEKDEWIEHGVNCIADFLKDDGSFYTQPEFNAKYGLHVDFLTYNGCKMSIKHYVGKTGVDVVNNIPMLVAAPMQKLMSIFKGSKTYYDIFVKNSSEPNCCAKWNTKVVFDIEWKKCFYKLQKIKDVTMKWFQIRIVHRIIATNVMLKEMRVTNTDLCSFCHREKDSISHMFWHCRFSQNFWIAFENWIKENCDNVCNLKMSESMVLFGIAANMLTDPVFDFIVLLAKQYIYSCRYNGIYPLLIVFKNKLCCRYKVERYNAVICQEVMEFDAAWYYYKELLK
jgi:hypothetical protein